MPDFDNMTPLDLIEMVLVENALLTNNKPRQVAARNGMQMAAQFLKANLASEAEVIECTGRGLATAVGTGLMAIQPMDRAKFCEELVKLALETAEKFDMISDMAKLIGPEETLARLKASVAAELSKKETKQ